MVPKKAAKIKVIHAVHLQPRSDVTMKLPPIGPAICKHVSHTFPILNARTTTYRSNESRSSKNTNRHTSVDRSEEISQRTTHNSQRRTSKTSTQEPTDQNRVEVLRNRDRDLEDSEAGVSKEEW
jgi:hypothetical protein